MISICSLVASKNVYLEALARQFCKDPKNTPTARGVAPIQVATLPKLVSLNKIKEKNPIPVVIIMIGDIRALAFQLNFLITVPKINILTIVAIIPPAVRTCPI